MVNLPPLLRACRRLDWAVISPFLCAARLRLPALSMRFGTNHDGLLIGVQIVSSWLAESTVLAITSRLEGGPPPFD